MWKAVVTDVSAIDGSNIALAQVTFTDDKGNTFTKPFPVDSKDTRESLTGHIVKALDELEKIDTVQAEIRAALVGLELTSKG